MRGALWACWQEKKVRHAWWLLGALLLVTCVWGGVGCGDATSGPLSAPLKEVRLSDGTRCVYGTISGGPGGVAAVSCDWGCPR